MKYKEPPIGYWIKKADELFTKGINEIQSKFGLTRTKWQIINSIRDNEEMTKKELFDLMEPFTNKKEVEELLLKFSWDNLIDIEKDKIRLTDDGIKFHTECLEHQKIFRQKCMQDIPEKDYQVTLEVLKKLVNNLNYLEDKKI